MNENDIVIEINKTIGIVLREKTMELGRVIKKLTILLPTFGGGKHDRLEMEIVPPDAPVKQLLENPLQVDPDDGARE